MKKTKEKRAYKFRAVIKKKSLYFYNCDGCGKKRSSRIYERALGKICQVCLKNKVPDNQPSLFSEGIEIPREQIRVIGYMSGTLKDRALSEPLLIDCETEVENGGLVITGKKTKKGEDFFDKMKTL